MMLKKRKYAITEKWESKEGENVNVPQHEPKEAYIHIYIYI